MRKAEDRYIVTFESTIRSITFIVLLLPFILRSAFNLPYILTNIRSVLVILFSIDPTGLEQAIAAHRLSDLLISVLGLYLVITYFVGPTYIKWRYGLRDLTNPSVINLIRDISLKMGIKPPRVYVSDLGNGNCYVFGYNAGMANIFFTQDFINSFNEEELKAVVTHELGHIKNKDISFQTWSDLGQKGLLVWFVIYAVLSLIFEFYRGWTDLFVITTFKQAAINQIIFRACEIAVIFLFIVLIPSLIFFSARKKQELLADARALLYLEEKTSLKNAVNKSIINQIFRQRKKQTNVETVAVQDKKISRTIASFLSKNLGFKERADAIDEEKYVYSSSKLYIPGKWDAMLIALASLYISISLGNLVTLFFIPGNLNIGQTNYLLSFINNSTLFPVFAPFFIILLNFYSFENTIRSSITKIVDLISNFAKTYIFYFIFFVIIVYLLPTLYLFIIS